MPLLQVLCIDNFTFVLTEQEVILFSPNQSIIAYEILPELASQAWISESNFVIQLFDETKMQLTRSGKLSELKMTDDKAENKAYRESQKSY